jgi:catechol 2,3-dioxygenase-like lactoylglutathione lyase family enzyme
VTHPGTCVPGHGRAVAAASVVRDAEAMLRIGTIVVGVEELPRAVDFWTAALGYVPERPIGPGDDFAILRPAVGAGPRLALDESESPVQAEPRVHLDLYAGDATDQAREVERLVSLGAVRVDWPRYPADPDFVVLADTEGNRFCVIDTARGPAAASAQPS